MYPDVSLTADSGTRRNALRAVLVAVNVAVCAGFALAVRIGRPRYFGMVTIAAAAVALLDLFVLCRDRFPAREFAAFVPVVRDRRVVLTAMSLSAFSLFAFGRGAPYFASVAVFVAVLLARILATDYRSTSWHFDLAVVGVAAAGLIASQSLTVAYYARTFDTIFHTTLARRIAAFGTLEAVSSTRYSDLALFHTQASVGIRITDLPARLYAGTFFALLFGLAVAPLFAVFRNVTGQHQMGLLAVAFAAFNPAFVRWGTQVHAQSTNFVFVAVFLLVLTKYRSDWRLTALAAVLAVAVATTHHLSAAMAVCLLSVPVLGVVGWQRISGSGSSTRPILFRYVLLVATIVTYWVATDITAGISNWVFDVNPRASQGITTSQFVIQTYATPGELADAAVPFLLNEAHYVAVLALAGYALWVMFHPSTEPLTDTALLVGFSFLVAAVLYVPNPAWMPLRGFAALNRWDIMTLPFLTILPALGLRLLAAEYRETAGTVLVAALVVGLVFASVGGGFTDPSLADAAGREKGAQGYFSSESVAGGAFVIAHRNGTVTHAPVRYTGYLQCENWTNAGPDRPRGFARTEVVDGEIAVEPGLTIVPERAFRESQIKLVMTQERAGVYERNVTLFPPVSDESVEWRPERHSIVYTNGGTVVAYAPQSTAGTAETPDRKCK